ncbi:MAG TPA: ATP synthase F1 subunit epsilon, partial [Solirubrobacterales bacterium]
MHVTVISPESAIFDGEADAVIAPAFDGALGVLPRHAPMMTLLGQGILTVRQGDSSRRFQVRGGFLQVVHDTVRVVAEHVQENPTD